MDFYLWSVRWILNFQIAVSYISSADEVHVIFTPLNDDSKRFFGVGPKKSVRSRLECSIKGTCHEPAAGFIYSRVRNVCRLIAWTPCQGRAEFRGISKIMIKEVGRRVGQERAEKCGGQNSTVGYQIKMEVERPRPTGSILYCTPGIILKWVEHDPSLSNVSHLILDEVHERELHTDFLLIITKKLLQRRPDLRLVLMSATLNAQQFSEYYGGCPVIEIPGRTFPVQEYFLEDAVEKIGLSAEKTRDVLRASDNTRRIDNDVMMLLLRHISMNEPPGAILVFLPGWEDILSLQDKLTKTHPFNTEEFLILPLHGSMMSTEEQQKVFRHPPDGVRKIVLSTNIAETSITMDDVVYVIDAGKLKLKNFDARRNISTLQAEWNSKANSEQRKGRAGRVKPGVCYHLYTRLKHDKLVPQHKPEMRRIRLEDICLQIKLLNLGDIVEFFGMAMDRPKKVSVERSIELLKKLKALDENEEITPLGVSLARLPVDPHIGKMILYAAMFGCLDPILTVAACLDDKSPFFVPRKKQAEGNEMMRKMAAGSCSDHLMFINGYNGWVKARDNGNHMEYCYENFLQNNTLKTIKKTKQHLAQYLHELGFIEEQSPDDTEANVNSENKMLIRAVVCAGLYPNVAKINTDMGDFDNLLSILEGLNPAIETTQGEVKLHPKSVNCDQDLDQKYLVYYQQMQTSKLFIHDATTVSHIPLLLFGLDVQVKPKEEGNCLLVLDSFITLEASNETAEELMEVRQRFFNFLDRKFDNPQPTDWSRHTTEGDIMNTIVDTIMKEKKK